MPSINNFMIQRADLSSISTNYFPSREALEGVEYRLTLQGSEEPTSPTSDGFTEFEVFVDWIDTTSVVTQADIDNANPFTIRDGSGVELTPQRTNKDTDGILYAYRIPVDALTGGNFLTFQYDKPTENELGFVYEGDFGSFRFDINPGVDTIGGQYDMDELLPDRDITLQEVLSPGSETVNTNLAAGSAYENSVLKLLNVSYNGTPLFEPNLPDRYSSRFNFRTQDGGNVGGLIYFDLENDVSKRVYLEPDYNGFYSSNPFNNSIQRNLTIDYEPHDYFTGLSGVTPIPTESFDLVLNIVDPRFSQSQDLGAFGRDTVEDTILQAQSDSGSYGQGQGTATELTANLTPDFGDEYKDTDVFQLDVYDYFSAYGPGSVPPSFDAQPGRDPATLPQMDADSVFRIVITNQEDDEDWFPRVRIFTDDFADEGPAFEVAEVNVIDQGQTKLFEFRPTFASAPVAGPANTEMFVVVDGEGTDMTQSRDYQIGFDSFYDPEWEYNSPVQEPGPTPGGGGLNNGIEYDPTSGVITFNPDPNNPFPPDLYAPAPAPAPTTPVVPSPGNELPSPSPAPAPAPAPSDPVPSPTPDPEPLPDVDPVTGSVRVRLGARGMFDSKSDFLASRFNVSASSPSELPELLINYVRAANKLGTFDDFEVVNVGGKSARTARRRLRKASRTDADFIYNKRNDKLYFNANGESKGYVKEVRDVELGGYLGKIEFERDSQSITEEIFTLPSMYEVMV